MAHASAGNDGSNLQPIPAVSAANLPAQLKAIAAKNPMLPVLDDRMQSTTASKQTQDRPSNLTASGQAPRQQHTQSMSSGKVLSGQTPMQQQTHSTLNAVAADYVQMMCDLEDQKQAAAAAAAGLHHPEPEVILQANPPMLGSTTVPADDSLPNSSLEEPGLIPARLPPAPIQPGNRRAGSALFQKLAGMHMLYTKYVTTHSSELQQFLSCWAHSFTAPYQRMLAHIFVQCTIIKLPTLALQGTT